MADDIVLTVSLDDKGLSKGLKQLSKDIQAFGKHVKGVVGEQNKLTSSQKKLNDETIKSTNARRINSDLLRKETDDRRLLLSSLKDDIIARHKETIAIREENEAHRISHQNLVDSERQRARETKETIKGRDAKRANAEEIKRETAERKQELDSLKQAILERHGVGKANKRLSNSQKQVGKGMTDITTRNRLLNNSFATLRSKLLLTSFAFGLVTAATTRNIRAFAEQEKSVVKLALQFGSQGADGLDKYASSLQEVTRFGDENINTMMATFGAYGANIEQTKALAAATLDFAEGEQMDLDSAARLVAKSFAGSTNALGRYGVVLESSMTKQEKINAIITQSQSKYGGLAKVIGNLRSTQLDKASNAFGDLRESLGETLVEGLLPIIKGFKSVNEAMQGLPIRTLVELTTSLTIAFTTFYLHGIGAKFMAAMTLANRKTTMMIAQNKTLGAGLVASAAKIRFFTKALMGTTGGWGVIIVGATLALTALFKIFGVFKETTSETQKGKDAIDEYAGSLNKVDTDSAIKNLDDWMKKLIETNEILHFSIHASMDDLIKPLNEVISTLPQLTDEILANAEEYNNVVAEQQKLQMLLDEGKNKTKSYTEAVRDNTNVYKDGSKVVVDYSALIAALPETIPVADESVLDGVDDRLRFIKSELIDARNAVDTFQNNWKVGFTEATGVSDEFFETYINNTGIMENLQSGVIQTNKDLLDVVKANLDQDGIFANLSEKEQNAIIAEITLKNELIKINSKLFSDEQKLKKWEDLRYDQKVSQIGGLVKAVGGLLGTNKKNAKIAARISQAGALIDTYAAVNKTFEQGGAMNPLTWVMSATILARGLTNVANIQNQIAAMDSAGSAPTFAEGGYVGGRPHSQGGTIIEAERGEFVMSRNAVESIGLETLNQMNQQGASAGGINVTVTGNVLTQDFVEGELAESIKEAIRRGSDFGLS